MGLFDKKKSAITYKNGVKVFTAPRPFPSDKEFVYWYEHLPEEERKLFLYTYGGKDHYWGDCRCCDSIKRNEVKILREHGHILHRGRVITIGGKYAIPPGKGLYDGEFDHDVYTFYDITMGDIPRFGMYDNIVTTIGERYLFLDESAYTNCHIKDHLFYFDYKKDPDDFYKDMCFDYRMLLKSKTLDIICGICSMKDNILGYFDFGYMNQFYPLSDYEFFLEMPEDAQNIFMKFATKELFDKFKEIDTEAIIKPMNGTADERVVRVLSEGNYLRDAATEGRNQYECFLRNECPPNLYCKEVEDYVMEQIKIRGIKQITEQELDYTKIRKHGEYSNTENPFDSVYEKYEYEGYEGW